MTNKSKPFTAPITIAPNLEAKPIRPSVAKWIKNFRENLARVRERNGNA
jgi:hypothetical protein